MNELASKVQAAINSGSLSREQIRQTFKETDLGCARPNYLNISPGHSDFSISVFGQIGASFCDIERYLRKIPALKELRHSSIEFPNRELTLPIVCTNCPTFAQTLVALAAKIK